MKIGIDAHAAEKPGEGTCTYIRNYLTALAGIDKDNEYILYVINDNHNFYQKFHSINNFNIRKFPLKNPIIRIPFSLAKKTFTDSLDILHVQFIAPPLFKGKLISTIHDLCFLHFPQTFSKFEALRSKIMIKNTAKHSDKIISGSHNSKNDIINYYNIESDKIEVIPYGISTIFSPEKDPIIAQKVLNKYQIKRPYVLSVGRLNPRKNLITLIKAFSSVKNSSTLPHQLVIAGRKDYRTHDITRYIRKNKINKHIILPGFVSDEELPYIYSQADLFVYPSLYEGVGLPVLEAMRSGVPVITSNNSSLSEIIEDAGITVPPLDSEQIARAIKNLLNNPELRTKCLHKGLERANKLNWEETAMHTLAVYEEVYKSK